MLIEKYKDLIVFAESLGFEEEYIKEEEGKLKIKGHVPYQLEKDLFWDKVKTFSDSKNEVSADIRVYHKEVYGVYEVEPGDSLSKIAKKFYGDAMRYKEIFDINTDILSNPDLIKVGQILKMPEK